MTYPFLLPPHLNLTANSALFRWKRSQTSYFFAVMLFINTIWLGYFSYCCSSNDTNHKHPPNFCIIFWVQNYLYQVIKRQRHSGCCELSIWYTLAPQKNKNSKLCLNVSTGGAAPVLLLDQISWNSRNGIAQQNSRLAVRLKFPRCSFTLKCNLCCCTAMPNQHKPLRESE